MPILDDFNRANEGPPPSANWTGGTVIGDTDGLKVVSNQLTTGTSGNGFGAAVWNPTTYGPDCGAYYTYISGTDNDIHLRLTGAFATPNSYALNYDGANTRLRWFRLDAGVATLLTTVTSITLAANDVLEFRAIGSSLIGYINSVQVGSTTDTTYTTAGNIAVEMKRGDVLDNFGVWLPNTTIPVTGHFIYMRGNV